MNTEEVIEKYKVQEGVETIPVIVLTGTLREFEEFCMRTGRGTKTAIAIRQPYQIDLYPDTDITCYGNYYSNEAYDSKEYKARIKEIQLRGV